MVKFYLENECLQYLAACTNFGWFLLFWYLAMCQIFCCSIIQGLSFNYHHRNVRSRVSVSVSNFQVSVSVSAFMPKSRSRLEIWARSRSRSRSRRLRSRLHHWYPEQKNFTNYYVLFPLHHEQLHPWELCSLNHGISNYGSRPHLGSRKKLAWQIRYKVFANFARNLKVDLQWIYFYCTFIGNTVFHAIS